MAIDTLGANALASDSVTSAKIADDAVTAAKIPAGAVVADIADGGITTAKLADDAVTSAKLDTNITIGGTLGVTGLITASGSIAVGGTGSANTLDDYEEGSFTPTYKNEGDNNLSPTYNSTYTHARYVKIGTLVQFQFTINLTNISGGSSGQHLILNNLPFTAKSYTTNSNGGVNVTYQSSIGTAMTFGMVLGSSTSIRFYRSR